MKPELRKETRYEIAFFDIDGTQTVLDYTARKTKAVLMNVARRNASYIIARQDALKLDDVAEYSKTKGWVFGGKIRVAYTGRTERTAYTLEKESQNSV